MDAAPDSPVNRLVSLLESRRADGTPRFPESERRSLLALLAVLTGRGAELDRRPKLRALVDELFQRLGLPPDADAEAITTALLDGRLKPLLSPELLMAVQALVRQELVAGTDVEARERARRFLGASPALELSQEQPVPNDSTLRAGPFAQYEASLEKPRGK